MSITTSKSAMKGKTINQLQAINLIDEGKDISEYNVIFNTEKIEAIQAILLRKNNIEVPSELVYYNDETIDFTDDPDITKGDFEAGKLVWNIKTSLPVDKEIKDWIANEKIDVDKLLMKLIRNFYETVKDFPKKAAL
jgi:hypothetical protein